MKRGITLIELIVAMALIGIVFFMISPVIKWYGRGEQRLLSSDSVTTKFEIVDNLIRDKVELTLIQDDDDKWIEDEAVTMSSGITIETVNGKSNKITLEVYKYENPEEKIHLEDIVIEQKGEELKYADEVLLKDVREVEFKLEKGILTYYIELNKIKDDLSSENIVYWSMGGSAILE